MLKSSPCGYRDAYILFKCITKTLLEKGKCSSKSSRLNSNFKTCAQFTYCISKTNDFQKDNAKDLDIMMSMYSLIEYSNSYAKTLNSLWKYCRDEPGDNTTNSE